MTRLQNVNTTDLLAAISLGCRPMHHMFNADDNGLPFFITSVWPHASLAWSPDLSECHVPGRHLNALLMSEAVAGVTVDPEAIASHRRAAFFSFSGPLRLPLNRQVQSGPPVVFSPHNLREGLHALYALVKYRGDDEARTLAEALIAEIQTVWSLEHGWEVDRFRALGLTFQPVQGPLNGETRMVGPLVKYYRATGYGPALELALRLKEQAVQKFFRPDGSYDHARFITDHTHSITGSLSSLAQLADLLDDDALLQRVKAFYDVGLWEMRDEIGWTPGGVFQQSSDMGESGNPGDIIETALILGRHGYPEYYADAERILRCHLLPSQLRDVSFMHDAPNPDGIDGLRAAADRQLGAFGVPAPYGFLAKGKGRDSTGFYMDVVGSVVGSLCAAFEAATRWESTGHWVNLHFDHDSPHLTVRSPYGQAGALEITLKRPGPLFVRRPAWVTPGEVVLEGATAPPRWINGYLFLAQPPVGTPLRLRYPLKETTLTLTQRVHAQPIRLRLRGDSPLAMDDFGTDLTFFEPYA
jgi:hypothetical protein